MIQKSGHLPTRTTICLSAHQKVFIRYSNLGQSGYSETMVPRKGLSPDEIANLLQYVSENESDGGELSCSNLDFDEDKRLSESDCE
ncbi:hypothetical protein TNCV_334451 [Trichonephila clavipes]|nr:hypothetical protein TNCV_334451 [Trichonephila clavipes]